MLPVSMVVYWMMILLLKQSDTCVNGILLNDHILIKTKWYLEIKTKWYLTNVSIVVYWMMLLWLKQSDTCVNGGLSNDDTLIEWKSIIDNQRHRQHWAHRKQWQSIIDNTETQTTLGTQETVTINNRE